MFNKNKPGSDFDGGLSIPTTPSAPEPVQSRAPASEAPRPSPSPASAPLRSSNLSTLTTGVKYEGNISGGGDLQIDGILKGDVRLQRVIIGEQGSVEGAITADVVEVRGRVSGTITGKSVRLHASSKVEGDITQEQLSVELGAFFQGRSIQAKRELPTAAALAEAEAAKPERYQPENPVAPAMPSLTAVKSEKPEKPQLKSA